MPSLILIVEHWPRQCYPLNSPSTTVGSSADTHVQLPSPNVAPIHATISKENDRYSLRAENPSHPTYVNGQAVSHSDLNDRDILRFGEYFFWFDLEDRLSPSEQDITKKHRKRRSKTSSDAKQDSKSRLRLVNNLLLILAFPMTALVTLSLTLYWLPLAARNSLMESKRFEQLPSPLRSYFATLLSRDKPSHEENVILQSNRPIRTTITVPSSIRLLGKLQLSRKSTAPFQLKIQVFEQNRKGEKQTVFVSDTIDVPSGTQSCTLFSVALDPAIYGFEGIYQSESSDPESAAKLLFYIE